MKRPAKTFCVFVSRKRRPQLMVWKGVARTAQEALRAANRAGGLKQGHLPYHIYWVVGRAVLRMTASIYSDRHLESFLTDKTTTGQIQLYPPQS